VDKENALANVREVLAWWYVGQATGSAFVRPACDLLVAGFDGPAVCALAGMSPDEADYAIADVIEDFLRETEIPYHPKESALARAAALRIMAERVVARLLSPHELTNWVHVTLRNELPPLAQRLAELDDVYGIFDDCMDPRHDDVDAMVMAEALRITALPSLSPGA
jgi:hypothetical protein